MVVYILYNTTTGEIEDVRDTLEEAKTITSERKDLEIKVYTE